MAKPRVNVKSVADSYASPNERIIEVTGQNGIGCLISVVNKGNGDVLIRVYRADPGLQVIAPN